MEVMMDNFTRTACGMRDGSVASTQGVSLQIFAMRTILDKCTSANCYCAYRSYHVMRHFCIVKPWLNFSV